MDNLEKMLSFLNDDDLECIENEDKVIEPFLYNEELKELQKEYETNMNILLELKEVNEKKISERHESNKRLSVLIFYLNNLSNEILEMNDSLKNFESELLDEYRSISNILLNRNYDERCFNYVLILRELGLKENEFKTKQEYKQNLMKEINNITKDIKKNAEYYYKFEIEVRKSYYKWYDKDLEFSKKYPTYPRIRPGVYPVI